MINPSHTIYMKFHWDDFAYYFLKYVHGYWLQSIKIWKQKQNQTLCQARNSIFCIALHCTKRLISIPYACHILLLMDFYAEIYIQLQIYIQLVNNLWGMLPWRPLLRLICRCPINSFEDSQGSSIGALSYTASQEYRVARNWDSWLLFFCEDRFCTNVRVQQQ